MDLSTTYQQMTDKEHILKRPDTYMGGVEPIEMDSWVFEEGKIISKKVIYIPGLYKLLDEGFVNCRDHSVRMESDPNSSQVTDIQISVQDDIITMRNNGNGIDVAEHPEHRTWIPEMIFAHLRSSTNYTNEKTIIGGKNGYGVKIIFIWSTEAYLETVDHVRGLKYTQKFTDNLNTIHPPVITKCTSKPYTLIRFKPDYTRFGIPGLTDDFIQLLKRRTYDIAAITNKRVRVKWNDETINIKSFSQYIDLYVGTKKDCVRVEESSENGRWEYAIALTPLQEFAHVSFVNGIHTSKGGTHVEYIMNQITRKLVKLIEKKKKVIVSQNSIKEQLILFLRCDIENPSFDSQTKDCMNTPFSKFGSLCEISPKFIEKVAAMGVMETACKINEIKDNKQLKKTDGTKTKNVRGIAKLSDANYAGTNKSHLCKLFITEGDSAKVGVVSGLSSDDRNFIGVYPLKGKMMNVRGMDLKSVLENKEISELKKILGLETNKVYTEEEANKLLRYRSIWILCDQDADGSHIKALCINVFETLWPSLLQLPNFMNFMNTPIIKATRGITEFSFYNDNEFDEWKKENNESSFKIKYYKGLGTSTGAEFEKYMKDRKIIEYVQTAECPETIDMIFNKKRAEDRKAWLSTYNRSDCLDTNQPKVSYVEFIHKELKHFSKKDNDRNIPSLVDGLKTSQRKILFGGFKRNLVTECKVTQFAGYISEHSAYHHGEASLYQCIKGMCQNFVGANNINLFKPNGQFGSRIKGGKDSASERYIFTVLEELTRFLFPKEDDGIMEYLTDDGLSIEPIHYVPIIPMILVNGTKGIGTGFSSEVLSYNPRDIISYIREILTGTVSVANFLPYYEGFRGTIQKVNEGKYIAKGIYKIVDTDKIHVSELPVGTWTDDFKEMLEKFTETTDEKGNKKAPIVKDIDDISKDTDINFTITLHKGKLSEIMALSDASLPYDNIEKTFKLYSFLSSTNMHLFDANDSLKKYETITEIIQEYVDVRLETYEKRKAKLMENIEQQLMGLKNKVNYIQEQLDGTIVLIRKTQKDLDLILEEKGYNKKEGDYKYLTRMSGDCVLEENVAKMIQDLHSKENDLLILSNTTISEMWMSELARLEEGYSKYITHRNIEKPEIKKKSKK